ncbi:hypothetical protein [Propylenella binzhouense]|uniref:Uncharacterized protein n=1 Tax=Propylenella binzhouense TaxID=2555902 RepID=A0A964WS07_9HYPH|nr:hypothetical protein [Propylenella binzhouense]MYZ46462.1 hypothetical protein [Propylenella binzhouense]
MDDEALRMRALWAAVLLQAITDATANPVASTEVLATARARDWFKGNATDFREVCEAAGLDPVRIHREALDRIAEAEARDGVMTGRGLGRSEHRTFTFNGRTLPLPAWSRETGIGLTQLHYRHRQGWSAERALTTPVKPRRKKKPGDVKNFQEYTGTGAGSLAQDRPKMEFPCHDL